MTATKLNRISGGLLVLLSVTSLLLLYLSSKPHGVDGVALANLMNAGKVPEIHALINHAERHAHLLPYERLGLWGALILMALLSIFTFRRSRSGEPT
jgi:hypothetical protein